MSTNNQLVFTQAAAQKVFSLLSEVGDFDMSLRVYITGGGCSGFKYNFTFDKANDDDFIIEELVTDESTGGEVAMRLLVQANCMEYLKGAEVDFVEDISGAQFVIRNPNATGTCGCGSSFSV